jgi:hypothetical protein
MKKAMIVLATLIVATGCMTNLEQQKIKTQTEQSAVDLFTKRVQQLGEMWQMRYVVIMALYNGEGNLTVENIEKVKQFTMKQKENIEKLKASDPAFMAQKYDDFIKGLDADIKGLTEDAEALKNQKPQGT